MNKHKLDLIKYLEIQTLMALATSDGKGNLWSASVYYLFDDDLCFYFLSNPNTIHCRNIEKHEKVSMVISDSDQKLSDDKFGIQISGICKKVSTLSQVKLALKMWNRLGVGSEGLKLEDLKERGGSRFYKITPDKIKIFDTNKTPREMVYEL